jgi:cobalt-zinc-cadmium efflux system outer membrane protein
MALALAAAPLPTAAWADQASKPVTPPAQDLDTPEARVSWRDIVKLVDRHPLVAAGLHERAAARAAVDAAGAAPNPNLEVTGAYGRARDSDASRIEWGVGLSIPLGWIVQRRARIDAAEAQAGAVGAQMGALRRDILLQLHAAFWGLVHEQERVAALVELDRQTAALAATVQRRVEAGERRPVESVRLEVESERVAGELGVARSKLEARRAQLALWLRLPAGKKLRAVADLDKLPRPMARSVVRSRARLRHPAIEVSRARIQALAAEVQVERSERTPDMSVGLFTDHELDRSAYGVSLSVELPLWNWNTGNIHRAQSALAAGRERMRARQLELESKAVELQMSCQASVALAARYRDRMRPRAAEAARIIERSYEIGDSTVLDVIDARRTFLETRTQFLAALVKAQTDCSRLAVLVGEELP